MDVPKKKRAARRARRADSARMCNVCALRLDRFIPLIRGDTNHTLRLEEAEVERLYLTI